MRGSPRAHPTLFVSPSTNRTYAVMVDVSTVRISEAPGVNIAYWRSRFANTQYEAVWRCITLGLRRHAPNKHHFRRQSCQNRESSWCRRDIAFSRAHLAKKRNAKYPTAASHSAWVFTHQTDINLDDDRVKTGNLRGVVVTSRFQGPNSAKYAMRATPPPHPTQLGSPRTKHISTSTVIV